MKTGYIHALSTAKIKCYLLSCLHDEALDKKISDKLNSALPDAEILVSKFHRRIQVE